MSSDDKTGVESARTEVAQTLSYSDNPTGGGTDGPEPVTLQRGSLVSRYVLLGKVGEGGMGTVYAAYDPELNRKVALKFLHSELTGHDGLAGAQTRLLREAQAMAQLSHPNVAGVFDVGTYHGRVFIAIEFIEGMTLRQWLDAESRDWQQLWPVLQGAGRGLAAAHAVSIIHRDFKPDNVLVDNDDIAHVTDFGLARPTAAPESSSDGLTDSSGALHEQLTRTGTLMGTPRYMAPEQHLGQKTGDHSDQFAFCVVLWEALYGTRAFAGDTLAKLSHAVTNGELVQPKSRHGVPAWRHQAMERGLSVDPEKRFGSMNELLAGLSRNPAARRNRFFGVGVGIAALLVAALLLWPSSQAAEPVALCTGAADVMEQTWNDGARQRIHDGFVASGSPLAVDSAKRVGGLFDDYATSWSKMHTESCIATNERGDQSAAMLDLRGECLDRRRNRMAALVKVFSETPTKETVKRSIKAAAKLPSLERCVDRKALRAVVPPPEDPAMKERIVRTWATLDRARALRRTGQFKAFERLLFPLYKNLETLRDAALAVEILDLQAAVLVTAGKPKEAHKLLEKAARMAAEARDDRAAAAVWNRLVQVTSVVLGKPDLGRTYAKMAYIAVARAGFPPLHTANYHLRLGEALTEKGQYKAAHKELETALQLGRKHNEHRKQFLAKIHIGLATNWLSLGDMAAAEKHGSRGLHLVEALYGPQHPDLVDAITTLGYQAKRRGQNTAAVGFFRRALRLQSRVSGAKTPVVISLRIDLAAALSRAGQLDQAENMFDSLLSHARTLKAGNKNAVAIFSRAAAVKMLKGKFKEARALSEQALAGSIKRLGPNHASVGMMTLNIAERCIDQAEWSCVTNNSKASRKIFTKALPANHLFHSIPLYFLGLAYNAQRKHGLAIRMHEQALAVLVRVKAKSFYRFASVRMGLARALVKASRANWPRAMKVAAQARKDFLRMDSSRKMRAVKSVERFIKKHSR